VTSDLAFSETLIMCYPP